MNKLLISLALPALLAFVACSGDDENNGDQSPDGDGTVTHTTAPTLDDNGPTSTLDPLAMVCAENPDPANDEQVQVDEPLGGDPVSSPLTVRGRVAAFEATFQITIFDASGKVLGDTQGMSSEGQTLAPFEEEITFSVTQETPACLWVYEKSARDGASIHVLQTPVRLVP
ncbi:MAG TPA: Gmad2 immunoglobulin-like domain-containing protein [Dehalococcoidia bacterium]|jgi:hypothetical protein|nr:Gmad2 immunoglobulin-like domain-containing protein [Dehalococcoidia bacterium]